MPGLSFTRLFEDSVQGRCFIVGLAEGISHFVCAVSVPVGDIQCIGDCAGRTVYLNLLKRAVEAVEVGDVHNIFGCVSRQICMFYLKWM